MIHCKHEGCDAPLASMAEARRHEGRTGHSALGRRDLLTADERALVEDLRRIVYSNGAESVSEEGAEALLAAFDRLAPKP